MIKITFWREGGANNSSSSHSIIFTKKELPTTEDRDFGWQFFTASDKESKLNYALICLYNSWTKYNELGWSHANIDFNDLSNFYQQQFQKWLPVDLHPRWWNNVFVGSVDHQSMFTFPAYRQVGAGVNIEFARDWINELLKDEYVILGGNDNTDETHEYTVFAADSHKDLIQIYDALTECPSGNIAVKDELTGEWVISLKGGGIIKCKFSNT